jgi:hypothetical protein
LLSGEYNVSDYHREDHESGLDTILTVLVDKHAGHCFDYLRQGIQCSGDMSLEHSRDDEKPGVDGWGVKHSECKSWVSNYS